MKKPKGSSSNSVTTNLKNNVNNVCIMTMNKLLKYNACHIQELSLKMRLMRALNLRYLSLESERFDKQTFI